MLDIVSKLFARPSEVAVLFDWNLSRCLFEAFSRTGRRFRSAALHRIRFWTCWFVPMPYFTQRLMDDWKIIRLSGAMSVTLVSNKFSRNPSNFHSTWKTLLVMPQSPWVTGRDLQNIKTVLTLELAQYHKVAAHFPQACCRSQQRLLPTRKVLPAQAVQARCPKSLSINFKVKTFDCLLE